MALGYSGGAPASYLSGGQQRAAMEMQSGTVQNVIKNDNRSLSSSNVPGSTPAPQGVLQQGSAAVWHPTDRSGMRNLFANGARPVARQFLRNGENGRTTPTDAQPLANTRVGVSFNDMPHRCGLPLNLGLSFKSPYQYYPSATGMLGKPWYTAVQRVSRSTGAPNAYDTRSAGV